MASVDVASPFRISVDDELRLARSDAFTAVRSHLRRQELGMNGPSFCSVHRQSCSAHDQECFRLHRDIIHTVLLPLFLLHNQASRIASMVLPTQRAMTEPERAFRGEARSAYSWLHCVLIEEHDCYLTERCPACIVLHVLNSEPTIRFIAVACLLSGHLQDLEFPGSKKQLPTFDFWLEALETAVREDPFWGDDFWPDIEYRACVLTDGVKQLVLQCLELRAALERQSLQSQGLRKGGMRVRCDSRQQMRVVAVDPSNCARKHFRMTSEDRKWASTIVGNCSLQSRCDRSQNLNSQARGPSRRRSLTS